MHSLHYVCEHLYFVLDFVVFVLVLVLRCCCAVTLCRSNYCEEVIALLWKCSCCGEFIVCVLVS